MSFSFVVTFSFDSISHATGWECWVFRTSQEIGCEDLSPKLWHPVYSCNAC